MRHARLAVVSFFHVLLLLHGVAALARQPMAEIGGGDGGTAAALSNPPACGAVGLQLSVDPPQPDCDDVTTLALYLELPDTCWGIPSPPEFASWPFEYWRGIELLDVWPEFGCATMIVPLTFEDTVGPLAPGPYTYGVQYSGYSARHGGSFSCSLEQAFDVVCCDDLPGPVFDLLLDKSEDGQSVVLTWNDVPGATDYLVFGEYETDVAFNTVVGTSASGTGGATYDHDFWPRYFLVAARNACGAGPRD